MNKQNPFTNNRFHFLDEDNITNEKFKSVKKEKKTDLYDSSNNSFTKEKNPTHSQTRNYNYNRNSSYNSFNSFNKNYKSPDKVKEVKIFNIEEIDFPEMENNIISHQTSSVNVNFKDALNKQNEIVLRTEIEQNNVKPGFIEISRINNKTVFKEGPLTSYMIEQNEKEVYENNPYYIMNKAICIMSKNWDRYMNEYDSIHGEGAYEEMFVLSPVYGPEYDTEEETENSIDSDKSVDL
jgi:hypothetical protein